MEIGTFIFQVFRDLSSGANRLRMCVSVCVCYLRFLWQLAFIYLGVGMGQPFAPLMNQTGKPKRREGQFAFDGCITKRGRMNFPCVAACILHVLVQGRDLRLRDLGRVLVLGEERQNGDARVATDDLSFGKHRGGHGVFRSRRLNQDPTWE